MSADNNDTPSLGRKLSELLRFQTDDPKELLKYRFLCREGVLGLYGPTGIGKSSLAMQLMILWALGRTAFEIIPKGPLKSLLIQAENDSGDLAEMRDGVIAGLKLTPDEAQRACENVIVFHEDSCTGQEFFNLVERALETHKPDLLWIDPALSYLGGDTISQKDVGEFLRNRLKPLLKKYQCGCVIVHHTNKTTKAGDTAYAGSGSAEWGNMPRAILTLSETANNSYELKASKRGQRLRWKKADGTTPTTAKCLRHCDQEGQICWLEGDEPDDEPQQTSQQREAAVLDSVPESGTIEKNALVEAVNKATGIGINTVKTLIGEMIANGRLIESKVGRSTGRPAIHIGRQPQPKPS